MKMKYSRILLILILGLSLVRCTTKVGPIDLTFTVYSYLQTKTTPDADTLYTDQWVGYYFEGADSLTYKVASFEDAKAGRLHNIVSNSTYNYTAKAETSNALVEFQDIRATPVMMLIVLEEAQMYAWRQLNPVDGLDEMSARLFFRTWRTAEYVESGWRVFPKVAWYKPTSYQVNAKIQQRETPNNTITSKTWKGYYYVVDNTDYKILNFEDAKNHVVTAGSGETLEEGFKNAENKATEHVLFSGLTEKSLMLVIYEEEREIFAYRFLNIAEGKEEEEDLVFKLFKYEDYTEGEWYISVPPKEEEPEE